MGAQRYEELHAWQLSRQLADEVAKVLAMRRAADDFDLFNQLRSASRSSCRNIAEGFGRYYPKEFAQFLRIARGSLLETGEHLRDARAAGWIDSKQEAELVRLRDRAVGATTRLIRYLDSKPPQGPTRPTKRGPRSPTG
ncbi:MAG: four helix bundle protein [Acidobacteria bacterium]|nr:four helix bundle protein [Acidobacteriota bacterium]